MSQGSLYRHNNPEEPWPKGQDPEGSVDDDREYPTWPKVAEEPADNQEDERISRRDFIKMVTGVGAVGLAALAADKLPKPSGNVSSEGSELPTESAPLDTVQTIEHESDLRSLPFESELTNEIAQHYGISMSSLINPGHEIVVEKEGRELTAFVERNDLLVPRYAMVGDWEGETAKISDTYDIPKEFVRTIVNLESGGNPNVVSAAGAVGLYQLMPEYHLTGDGVPEGYHVPEADWYKPAETWQAAGRYMQVCFNAARDVVDAEHPEERPLRYRHPDIIARAAVIYNAGPSEGAKPYGELPIESQQYAQHIIRSVFVAQIVAELMDRGVTDPGEIARAIEPSDEYKARMYAFSKFKQYSSEFKPDHALQYLAQDSLSQPEANGEGDLYRHYLDYAKGRAGPLSYDDLPVGPDTWAHMSTSSGFVEGGGYEDNKNLNNYPS